ncbi:unnamed protein product [Euphydryas editha]|uniref:Uncharacterized protein n=1 Tax=Euphydryas editha TaxID=104508 RepID=A0AAU9V3B2_EUPED|nr:unnamed protein product [Euphydryas editha]
MDRPVEKLLKSIEELTTMMSSRMGEFEKSLPAAGTTSTNPTIKTLAAEFHSFKNFVWQSLNLLKSQVELVVLGMDRLETHSRRKVLLLHGVKEDSNEDVLKKTLSVLSDNMKLVNVNSDSLETCHRLGAKKDTARPILVRFSSTQLRARAWRAKTTLKGTKITITEFLTKARQDVFAAARNHFGMRKCWSADGVIVVLLPDKTRAKITTSSELNELTSQYPKSSITQAKDS